MTLCAWPFALGTLLSTSMPLLTSRNYTNRNLRDRGRDRPEQAAHQTLAGRFRNFDDVVRLQQNVVGLFPRNRAQTHIHFSLPTRLLPEDVDTIGFGIAQSSAGHRDRARDRDWLFQRDGLGSEHVANDVSLVGLRNRHDVAGLDEGICLLFPAQRVV